MSLQVTASVSDMQLTLEFSHGKTTQNYYTHLLKLQSLVQSSPEDYMIMRTLPMLATPFPLDHQWNFTCAPSENKVLMRLPESIKVGNKTRYDVEIIFFKPDEAKFWRENMLLWTSKSSDLLCTLSPSLTIKDIDIKIGQLEGKTLVTLTNAGPARLSQGSHYGNRTEVRSPFWKGRKAGAKEDSADAT